MAKQHSPAIQIDTIGSKPNKRLKISAQMIATQKKMTNNIK